MKISVIGSGNVATVLAKRLYDKGFTIVEIYSKQIANAFALAKQVNATTVEQLTDLNNNTDIIIIAVADKAIETLVQQLSFNNQLIVHTAGSVSINVLKSVSGNYGVLYPLQSIRKQMNDEIPIPFLIDGNNELVLNQIKKIAAALSKTILQADDDMRLKLHVAAVFACNFTNFMYLQSATFCEQENIPFSLLQDLIEETANRNGIKHPSEVFTGPAIRNDTATIEKHLQVLNNHKNAKELYEMLTKKIIEWKQ
jgi:predicted short-subunit dehydrogenase-like oxidoreductase (DUF2520 family)